MPSTGNRPAAPSSALLAWYNAVPNVFWSALSLTPLSIFCYQHIERRWLYGLLFVSLLLYALPASRFKHLQISRNPLIYRKLGVVAINRFTQHGGLVNWLIRRTYPQYRRLRARSAVAALVRTTYHQERFHLVLFVFFLLTSFYAVAQGYWRWALLLTLLNVGYNLYPMWLQQYIRVRLEPKAPAS
ncbi:glycosyl-4,4'-diaponeurosporenoate acyltransferase CrtO family protein [Hymenobacter jejuensis]|uniref:Glycosyl-4,4'-diaponeurosporenoate acyltransferase n=1 Tax=Hymenobacter jejuensis TaxID=2502781 RepID=A0A5B8A221_9BACT|nr:hypothetical protein [Hymenobacter jejuensis]QDA60242.1 hypothetical protein FHG12_09010 [Hymenobacter jejuensis]